MKGKPIVEVLFNWFDKTTSDIQAHLNETYLDSLVEAMATLFYDEVADDLDDMLQKKLETSLEEIREINYTEDDLRKAIQLVILKGMKGTTQDQHLMTPEAIGLVVGYLANKLMRGNEEVRLFDPVAGTANLLTTVMAQLPQQKQAFASEVDPTLIQLGVLNANLQKKEAEFFHQDSLTPFLLDPVDLVIGDLPVGYYPDDVRAATYKLKAEEGHSYSHHLLIEQSLKYTKEGGYLIFIIPQFLFESDQSEQLKEFFHEEAHIVGVLALPESTFHSKQHAKSILILQKRGEDTNVPKQPLLVQLPSLNNAKAMEDILTQMNTWFQKYEENH